MRILLGQRLRQVRQAQTDSWPASTRLRRDLRQRPTGRHHERTRPPPVGPISGCVAVPSVAGDISRQICLRDVLCGRSSRKYERDHHDTPMSRAAIVGLRSTGGVFRTPEKYSAARVRKPQISPTLLPSVERHSACSASSGSTKCSDHQCPLLGARSSCSFNRRVTTAWKCIRSFCGTTDLR
jgi:hypothetical protein